MALAGCLIACSLAGCARHVTKKQKADEASSGASVSENYAMILSSADNAYDDRIASGFTEVMNAEGKTFQILRPDKNPAQDQNEQIAELTSGGASCIAISPVDADAVEDNLKKAMEEGIDVCSFDNVATPDSREIYINQTGTEQIAMTLMDAVLDLSGGEGQWAILSSTSTNATQNEWIDAMHTLMKDDKYSKLELMEIAYGDAQYQRAYDQTKSLLQNYPDLKVICVPTSTSITAACDAVRDADSSVKITGFGLPSEMADYVGSAKSCPYFYLWNPINLGRLTAYVSIALHDGEMTGALDDEFTAGDMGDFTVTKAADGGTEVIVGFPYKFDETNIDDWKSVF